MQPNSIQSRRLDLVLMTPAFLDACLANDLKSAEAILELTLPPDWFDERALMLLRVEQLRANPAYAPWMLRAMRLRETGQMVGHIGFHTQPGADYLRDLEPDAVEFGYTVFPAFRRQHYAYEASAALISWAQTTYGVTRFVASASPENVPSLGLIQKLGFHKIGSQIDEVDGPEDIFVLYCS